MAAGSNGHVTAGSPEDGLDLPTRVLDFATELVTNPGSAPLAAATRVEADHFEVTDAGQGQDDDADVLRLQWTADQHVVLQRGWAPFARAEITRASALLRLAAAVSGIAGDAETPGWVGSTYRNGRADGPRRCTGPGGGAAASAPPVLRAGGAGMWFVVGGIVFGIS